MAKEIKDISKNFSEYIDINSIENIDVKQDKVDNNLQTEDKTIVGAINELFQSANNGKELIADAIGNESITVDSTFSAMGEAIIGLRRESINETDAREVLYNMMIEDGYNEVTNEMIVDELITLLDDSQIEIGDIKQISCGGYHTFILKTDGSIWACGWNNYGQLGLGTTDTNAHSTFTQVTTNINNDVKQIACGIYHTVILKTDGSVWSCGDNTWGQLGLNDTTSRTAFTQVTTDVKQIACGNNHTFILKTDGSVWSCGYNEYGQLGLNDTTDKTTLTQVTTNVSNDVKRIACGNNHTFVLKNDGSVYSCGYNYYGQLGLNSTTNQTSFTQVTTNINNDIKQIACGYYHTVILKTDGSIWCCGYNSKGQLGLNDTTSRTAFTQVTTDVKQIACGYYYTFILKSDGSLWACGSNSYGQLGLGSSDTNAHSTFTQVTTDVKQIACGNSHTIILKSDGSIWCCGFNIYGQLGLNDTTDRTTFTNTNFCIPVSSQSVIDEYEVNRQKLYYYLSDNSINVTESMDIGNMLDLLVDDYINNMILGYESNLRIMLTDEGVDVTEEDDMASLITKVDEEFDNQVVPAGTAVASNVLSGKTFINSTGQTITGTMTNRGSKTFTPSASKQTGAAGYYSGITVNTDSNLVAENIVSGVSIFGVTGTASSIKYATGSGPMVGVTGGGFGITVSNLDFTPTHVYGYALYSIGSVTNIYVGSLVIVDGNCRAICYGNDSSFSYDGIKTNGFSLPLLDVNLSTVPNCTCYWTAIG